MNIRIYNVKILSCNDKHEWFFESGEVHIKDSLIIYVGNGIDKCESHGIVWDREIDGDQNVLMPGFKNAHSHSAMTFLRSYADNVDLDTWLNKYIFPMESKLTPELVYWATILAIMEYLSSGITANFDMYFHSDRIAQASIDTGFRTVMTSALSRFSSGIYDMEKTYYKINEMSELTSYLLGFHAEYTASMQIMEGVAELSQRLHSPVWFHNSETKREVIDCKRRWGLSPTCLADKLGMFRYGGGGYHCVWLDEEDMSIFYRRKLTAVINSASNLKLNSGIAPVRKFVDLGINVAIGTDGAASNNSLDMFKEMFLAAVLSKLQDNNANSLSASQVLYMATAAGALAMGLYDSDNIAVGKKADLIMIDIHQPNMQPSNNIIGNIVYSASKQNVIMTMVNGKILYEHGKYNIGITAQEVYDELKVLLSKIRDEV